MDSLQELRLRRDLTPWELARLAGVNVRTIHAWQSGQRSPSPLHIALLARVLRAPRIVLQDDVRLDRERRRLEADASDYPEPIAVPAEWARGTLPGPRHRRVHPHGGYAWAARYVADHRDALLVHGTFQPRVPVEADLRDVIDRRVMMPMPHAWAEIVVDGHRVAFDGVTQRFYDLAEYYSVMKADPEVWYTADEADRLLLQHGWYGDWRTATEAQA